MKNELLRQLEQARSEQIAAIDDQGQAISYAQLLARADAVAKVLGPQKQLVLLEGGLTVDWLVAYVACLLGNHACMLAPVGSAQVFDRLAGTFRPGIAMREADRYAPQPLADGVQAIHPDLCVLLSTSGSTGSAKCVRLSQQNISSNAASIAEYLQIGQDERGVVSLPTHYSYGLSIINSHLYAGATLLMTARSMVDAEFWPFCREHGATSFAGVPHNYDLLERVSLEKVAPPSLRYFTQAGGKLQAAAVERFAKLAQTHGWRFYVMYGQTEASPRMAYLPPAQALVHPDSIGVPVPGGAIAILDEHGVELPAGERGEMVYRGPNVMMGYATRAEELDLPAQLAELRTGDIAYRDEQGLFYIVGRLSRFIKIFGNRIGLDDVERIGAEAELPCIATGIDGHLLVVTRDARASEALGARLAAALKLPINTIEVRKVQAYPLLSSGKIDYASLKASIVPAGSGSAGAVKGEQGITSIFTSIFEPEDLDDSQSFTSLGGDSLNYVRVSLDLEQVIGFLPAEWEELSIGELKRLAVASRTAPLVKPQTQSIRIDILRGIAAVLVVLHHVTLSMRSYYPLDMMPRWPHHMDWIFINFRMATFFLCSGIIYATSASKGLKWFLSNRLDFFLWIIVVWTCLQIGFERIGINLYPWLPLAHTGNIYEYFYTPKGALWFIFAVFILSGYASLTSRLSKPLQLGLALLLAWAASFINMRYASSDYQILLSELTDYGFPMFILGAACSAELKNLFSSTKRLYMITVLGAAIFVTFSLYPVAGAPKLLTKTLPLTFSFVCFVLILCRVEWFKKAFSSIGKWSFEIFLIHLFVIGLIYYGLDAFGLRPAWYVLWIPVLLVTLYSSMLLGHALSLVPGNIFFRPPHYKMLKNYWQVRSSA
ncbi:AMP-binding protein [Xylophilus sp. GOD-11R]|uniref:AMP-binding protein n=1 Tax=Xylophilus sp. GOD-11R TaxID=3089814 RepID=UPI00298BC95B|nr:AMP-binding protein [Xylophilus sp. GOD-11R]WPB54981.1 AMP-binding protein [Xylophilus sp. GOD-11R]